MDYKLEVGKKCDVTLTVTFPESALKEKLEVAASKVSESVEIKGFRKGKAPLDKVIKEVGEMTVLEHAAEMLVHKSYAQILTDEKIEPYTQPKIEFIKLAPGNDFEYKATFTKIPSVELGDISKLKVQDVHVHVQEEDVDKVINDLREYSAAEVLKDKTAEMGDLVEIDFEGFKDNVPFDGGKAENYKLLLGKGQMIPGFEEGVVGMNKGDEKDLELSFPKDYHSKNLAGQKVVFKIKLNAVYERTLPEANDSFAKLHGKETILELKDQIEHQMRHEEEGKQNQRIEIEIIEGLIKASKFEEIPDVLVNQEIEKMLGELKSQIMQQGMKFEDYLTHLKKSEEELRIDMTPQALDRVKAALVTRSIYINNDMTVTDEELKAEIEKYKAHYQDPNMQAMLENEQYLEMVRNVLGNQKVMEYLKSQVQLETTECDHKH